MVSAVIQEDRYEVSVTVSFVSAGREDGQVCSKTPELTEGLGRKLKWRLSVCVCVLRWVQQVTALD